MATRTPAVKKTTKSPNADIDGMIKKMKTKFGSLKTDEQINVIKVAIMWEKTKSGIRDDDEGSFFSDDDTD